MGEHTIEQQIWTDNKYSSGARPIPKGVRKYLVEWRLLAALRRLRALRPTAITQDSRILVICSGDGYDGSVLCDDGFRNVTVADISQVAVNVAVERDPRLKGIVLNAESMSISDESFDVVVVQDGLHHLQEPVHGFAEMLRVASRAVVALEPHDSMVGRVLGMRWEKNGGSCNFVFRWTAKLSGMSLQATLGLTSFEI